MTEGSGEEGPHQSVAAEHQATTQQPQQDMDLPGQQKATMTLCLQSKKRNKTAQHLNDDTFGHLCSVLTATL